MQTLRSEPVCHHSQLGETSNVPPCSPRYVTRTLFWAVCSRPIQAEYIRSTSSLEKATNQMCFGRNSHHLRRGRKKKRFDMSPCLLLYVLIFTSDTCEESFLPALAEKP